MSKFKYKCPKCDGEFNEPSSFDGGYCCPFCATQMFTSGYITYEYAQELKERRNSGNSGILDTLNKIYAEVILIRKELKKVNNELKK